MVFQDKFRALIGHTKHSVQHYVENGFSSLPRGSFIQLEKQAKAYILSNLKQAVNNRKSLIHKIKYFEGDTGLKLTIENFLHYHGLSLYELYGGRTGNRSFNGLKGEAGVAETQGGETWSHSDAVVKRIPALLSLNSRRLLKFLVAYLEEGKCPLSDEERLMLNMFYYTFYRSEPERNGYTDMDQAIQETLAYPAFREEIIEILKYKLSDVSGVQDSTALYSP